MLPTTQRRRRQICSASRHDRDTSSDDAQNAIIMQALLSASLSCAITFSFPSSPAPPARENTVLAGGCAGPLPPLSEGRLGRQEPRGDATAPLIRLRLLQAGELRLRQSEKDGFWELQHWFISGWDPLELSPVELADAAALMQAAIDEGNGVWLFKRGEMRLELISGNTVDIWRLDRQPGFDRLWFQPAELPAALRLLRTAQGSF